MRIGLVGFAGAGRSTLFTALTGSEPSPPGGNPLAHFSVGVVQVPDERLEWLRDLYQPKKYTPATVEFVDFAGIPRATEKGKAELFARIRDMDVLVGVVSAFQGAGDAVEVEGTPAARIQALSEEFLFADLEIVERRIERIEDALKKGRAKEKEKDERELELMHRCREKLEAGGSLQSIPRSRDEESALETFRFLQQKPLVAVIMAEEGVSLKELEEQASAQVQAPLFAVYGQVEAEIATMPEDDRPAFLKEYGLARPAVLSLVQATFESTRSIPFFTVGEDEVRAWVIQEGDSALTAAGCVHSDIARGFIRGEVTPFEDLKEAGTLKEAKAENKMRLEGKEYVVQNGDIVHFRFSV